MNTFCACLLRYAKIRYHHARSGWSLSFCCAILKFCDIKTHRTLIKTCLYCQIIGSSFVLSKPQPDLNTRLGLTWKWLSTPHPTPQQYLSCYWPDFDETLKRGSWEHLEQIPTVMVTFVQATFVLTTIVHIKNISGLTDPILMKL